MTTDTMPIHTTEIGFPWAKPVPHTSRHLTWHARARRARNRFMRSAFMADIRHGYRRACVIIGAFTAFFIALMVFRGLIVAADMAGLMAR